LVVVDTANGNAAFHGMGWRLNLFVLVAFGFSALATSEPPQPPRASWSCPPALYAPIPGTDGL